MKIATILPVPHLHLEEGNGFHMTLAHLLGDEAYQEFFSKEARQGNFVMLDNSIIEVGTPLKMENLIKLAVWIKASELVIPDALNDMGKTIKLGEDSISKWFGEVNLVAVPQGKTKTEWLSCLNEVLLWPIKTVGISRMLYGIFEDRCEALSSAKRLLDSEKNIHLLGCRDLLEIRKIRKVLGDRVRSVDSGISAIYSGVGMRMSDGQPKPQVELNFHKAVDEDLLKENIAYWKNVVCGGND
jgi:hypothetical protein